MFDKVLNTPLQSLSIENRQLTDNLNLTSINFPMDNELETSQSNHPKC